MSIYYWDSGLSWKQYLQVNSFVQDITGTIRKTGKENRYAISEQTKQIVASNDALARNFQQGFDQVNGTLNEGFGMLEQQFDAINEGIEHLGAAFEYGMSLITEQLSIQAKFLGEILERLDAIHKAAITPTLTQAREFYNIGRDRLHKGLLDKALEAFLKAEEKNDTDFFTQYSLGHLYLYGMNEECNVIDLSKAEQHFRDAVRYAKVEIANLPEARKYCGEAYLHASIACYAQASEQHQAGNNAEAERLIQESANLAKQTTNIYPELAEGFYQHAKICALTGDTQLAVQNLKIAVSADRNYCLKAEADRDFDSMRSNILNLFETLRQQAEKEAKDALNDIRRLIEEHNFLSVNAKQAKETIKTLLKNAKDCYQSGTYFDYLDALKYHKQVKHIINALRVPDELLMTFHIQGSMPVYSVSFSANSGRYLASGGLRGIVQVWDVPSWREVATLQKRIGEVYSVSFSPDGQYLASGEQDFAVRIWNVPSWREVTTLQGKVYPVSFSPDGQHLASGSGDGTVQVWDVPSWREVAILQGHAEWVRSVTFSPDGQYLVSGSADRTIRVWDVSSWREISILQGCTDEICSVTFSPDGRYLVSGSEDRTIRVWDVPSWREVTILQGHTGWVCSVTFSPDGQYLVSGSADRTIRVWDVSSWREISILQGHTDEIWSVLFSPDGRYLASGGQDSTVRIWGQQHIISKQEFEAQEEEHSRQKEEKHKRQQEIQADRRRQGLCEGCGISLGFFDKLMGNTKCKNCR